MNSWLFIAGAETLGFVILGVIFYGSVVELKRRDRKGRAFNWLVGFLMAGLAGEVASLFLSHGGHAGLGLRVANYVSHASPTLVAACFCRYVVEFVREHVPVSDLYARLPIATLEGIFVLVTVATFAGEFICLEPGNLLRTSVLVCVPLSATMVVLAYLVLFTLCHVRALGRHDATAMGLYGALPLVGALIENLFPQYPVGYLATVAAAGILAMLVQSGYAEKARRDLSVLRVKAKASANFAATERALRVLQMEESLENLRPFLEVVRGRFGADNCSLVRIDLAAGKAVVDGRYDLGGERADDRTRWEMATADFLPGGNDRLVRGEMLTLDAAEAARLWRAFGVGEAAIAAEGPQTLLIVPLRVKGNLVGALNVSFKRTHELDEFDRENLLRLAEVLVSAIERRRRHLALQQALEDAKAASRAKATFLATMSHEIRTPLNAIVGFVEFLQDATLDEEHRQTYLAGITRSSNALLALINDILDLSKIDAGKMGLRGGRCDFRRLFEEMKSIFSFRVQEKGLTLTYRLAPDFPVLELQEERIRQILLNLIGNAAKFTQAGHVAFSADYVDEDLMIEVEDSGCGIAPENRAKIFDPYIQDAGVRGGNVYHGTGLGLPICKRLVESVGGRIAVTSEVGKGSTFTLVIPHVAVAAAEAPEPSIAAVARVASPAARTQLHVVLVDDVSLNLKVLSRYVEMAGVPKANIVVHTNPSAALADILALPADRLVVFTDMWMPELSGEALARRVRSDAGHAQVPLIAVTADADTSDTFDMSLFNGVVTKPATSAKIKEALAGVGF